MRYFLLNEKDKEDIFSAVKILNIKFLELFLKREILTEFLEKEIAKMEEKSRREIKEQMEYAIKNKARQKKILDQKHEDDTF